MALVLPSIRQRKFAILGLIAFTLILTLAFITRSEGNGGKTPTEKWDSSLHKSEKKSVHHRQSHDEIRRATQRKIKHYKGQSNKSKVAQVISYFSFGGLPDTAPSIVESEVNELQEVERNDRESEGTTVSGIRMATHDNFDAERVFNLFCSCRIDDDLLLLDCYVNAYEELCKLFRHFGTVFGFVTSDVEEKIGILRDYRKSEHAEKYKTIQSMLSYEVSSETVKKRKANSGARTLLRLHRALEFITAFLHKLRETDNQAKFSGVVTKAYDDTLAKHHPWLIRKAVHMAMYMLPSRPDLLKKMGLEDSEKDMQTISQLTKELDVIYNITQELYAKDKLLDLP